MVNQYPACSLYHRIQNKTEYIVTKTERLNIKYIKAECICIIEK